MKMNESNESILRNFYARRQDSLETVLIAAGGRTFPSLKIIANILQ